MKIIFIPSIYYFSFQTDYVSSIYFLKNIIVIKVLNNKVKNIRYGYYGVVTSEIGDNFFYAIFYLLCVHDITILSFCLWLLILYTRI